MGTGYRLRRAKWRFCGPAVGTGTSDSRARWEAASHWRDQFRVCGGGGVIRGMKHFAQALVPLSLLATLTEAHAEEIHQVAALPLGLDPTHLHLLTNHIPIFITLAGILALALSFLWKSETAKRIALLLLFVGTVGGLATFWLGQESYKPVRGLADETGQDWPKI